MTTPIRADEKKLPDEGGILLLQAALKRYCLSLTRSSWDAEDLAQDTWLKALAPLRAGHGNPEAFLLRIAKNTWLDAARRKSVLKRKLPEMREAAAFTRERGNSEAEPAFQAMMKHLSPLQRTVFLLRDVLEYSSAETAELLDTTEGAVKAALHRARRAMTGVREDLLSDGPPLPEEPDIRVMLERMADAYERGRIAELIELARRDPAGETAYGDDAGRMRNVRLFSMGARPFGMIADPYDMSIQPYGLNTQPFSTKTGGDTVMRMAA